jgi:hypothetical protein
VIRARTTGALLLMLEVVGCLAMWVPIPAVWMWIGARVFDATGSMGLDLLVALGGFTGTTMLTMGALNRIDAAWVALRRGAGHDQREGALTQIVVVSATVALVLFWIWFHIVEQAFIIPFMPNR